MGELINLENGFAFKSEYFQEDPSDVIVLTPGNVNIGGGFQSGKGRFYNIAGKFPDKFIFKPGDIFVTMTDLTPSGQTLGLPVIVPDDGITYLHNQRLGKLVNFSGDREFLFYVFNTEDYHKHIVATASGTTVKHSSSSKILDYVVHIPIIEEQTKIGAFLSKLDNTIALHQRKVTLLKRLKEAYLTRMLPQNSENIPLLRFADYFDPWEQRKFEDLAESFNYGLNASAMEFDGENKYIRITDIDEYSHRFIQSGLTSPNTDLSNANDYLLKEGDILFARTGASVGKSYQYDPLDGKVYYAGFLIRARIKPEFDSSFIFQNTLTEKYNNFIKITSQRSG